MVNRKENIFTWNDTVVIKSSAPASYSAGRIAVVCGMEEVESVKLSVEFNIKIGDWIYTIEFGDGSSIEIPEIYLEKYQQ